MKLYRVEYTDGSEATYVRAYNVGEALIKACPTYNRVYWNLKGRGHGHGPNGEMVFVDEVKS